MWGPSLKSLTSLRSESYFRLHIQLYIYKLNYLLCIFQRYSQSMFLVLFKQNSLSFIITIIILSLFRKKKKFIYIYQNTRELIVKIILSQSDGYIVQ